MSQYKIEYWIKRGYSESEAEENVRIRKLKSSQALEGYIYRLGEEEGRKAFEKKSKKKRSNPYDEETYIQKGFSKKEAEEKVKFNKLKISTSLEGYIYRLGEEEGRKEYIKKCKRDSFRNTLEGKIDLYGEEEGKRRHKERSERQSKSLVITNFKKKYKDDKRTDEEILQLYEENKSNIIKENRFKASSESLVKLLPIFGYAITLVPEEDIYFGFGNYKEYFINYEENKRYYYDFAILSKKIIIEYDGHRFHGDGILFSNKEESIILDAKKTKVAEDNGFTVYRINKDTNIENFIKKIKENYED